MTTNTSTAPPGPPVQTGVGVIVPYDMALDRELWRWTPDDVALFFTRTPFSPMPVTVEMAEHVSDSAAVSRCTRDLITVSPAVYAYGCTSGSFVRGVRGERQLVEAMRAAGAPAAVTTSGALLAALKQLAAVRVAIATPYDPDVTERLGLFLREAGVDVVGSSHLGLSADIWKVPYARTAELVAQADHAEADAIVISCTNLPTYDVIAPLEARLGKPVISANQATMWAALRAIGRRATGPGQRLLGDH
ncbi:maleate cis-trans isomerase family protein [Nonomuraea guangzhouensis]|uniref:Asp/Glu/hydantoin racemase n=1 Tax=Nonomuraea guangzhouensis TaxID=1291555 RepID=A0ABW4G6R2_9ACTN|nr:Asp/Glu racemase [Nonomuraea guangzhouensis]